LGLLVIAAGLVGVLMMNALRSERDPISELAAASSGVARNLEPRLSGGFAWAPFHPSTGTSSIDAKLGEAIGRTLTRGGATPSATARHATGVALLLHANARDAMEELAATARGSTDPAIWSDLAAADHEASLRLDAPQLLADALTAADHALELAPRFPEALFNRALIIEHLGLKDDARDAWQRFLNVDSTRWADEARAHLRTLRPEQPFLVLLDHEYDRVARDPSLAASLVARDPFGARGMGATEVLGRWARAVQRGDERDANRHLAVARHLGEAVARSHGEHMLERSVAVIDGAEGVRRRLLADAHADYSGALKAFQERRPADAEKGLRRAASEFERAGSPMLLCARYFAANTMFEQGRHDEAERDLESLRSVVSAEYPAWRAMILWQIGTCRSSRGEWGPAITFYEQAASAFRKLGEVSNEAWVRLLLAFVYERIGDSATAWGHHVAALRAVGGHSNATLARTLSSVAGAAILRREWPAAAAFLNLTIDTARRIDDQLELANVLVVRAVVRDRLGDAKGAHDDIAAASAAAGRTDPAYRALTQVARLRATALLSDTPPSQSDTLLTEAIEYQATSGDRLNLPELLLDRARARRNERNLSGAMTDLEQGIAELERHRSSLPEGEARWGAFHAAEELFDEGVSLAVSAGDHSAAFRFAERGRQRALLEAWGRPPTFDYHRLPSRTVVISYVSLPDQLVILSADISGVHATTVPVTRPLLGAAIEAFTRALRDGSSAAKAAPAAYRLLIAPIAPQLVGASTIVVVPDAATTAVPFNALSDASGNYLLRDHAIVIAPSAAVFVAAEERRGHVRPPTTSLVIAAAAGAANLAALPFVDAEARQVAAEYRHSTTIAGDAEQLSDLTRLAQDAGVIHFAGHAIGDEQGFEPASIVLHQGGGERRVRVGELAALHLRPSSIVVLAGCSTSRGQRRASEGVISVAHGFLSAGSSSVIATLWPIEDDAAGRFFPRLHRRLAQGLAPAEALREVQLECIQRGDVPASLWAAVQDIGS